MPAKRKWLFAALGLAWALALSLAPVAAEAQMGAKAGVAELKDTKNVALVLVTATAFLLAIRLDTQVVAILGLIGGFLTPVLLSTGVDNPVGAPGVATATAEIV